MSHLIAHRKKIVFVSSSLGGGGAERVLITMAEYWSAAGHEVVILTLRSDPGREYQTPVGVAVERLGIIHERNPFWRPTHPLKLRKLRSTIIALKPDVVISFIDKLNTAVLLALAGTRIRVVATEHLAPWMNPLGPVWERLRKLAYRRALAVVSPTEAITDWFKTHSYGHFVTLPYPARQFPPRLTLKSRPVVLGVGRLTVQKGFDILIEAFAQSAAVNSDWRLEIAGEGPARTTLEAQIGRLGLQGRASLLGQVDDIASLYYTCEIFALSSRHEAYPMVLCEALSAGCCVLATDCPTGPREILGDMDAGILVSVNRSDEFGRALGKLMQASELRNRLSVTGRRRALSLGGAEVMKQWELHLARWLHGPQ